MFRDSAPCMSILFLLFVVTLIIAPPVALISAGLAFLVAVGIRRHDKTLQSQSGADHVRQFGF